MKDTISLEHSIKEFILGMDGYISVDYINGGLRVFNITNFLNEHPVYLQKSNFSWERVHTPNTISIFKSTDYETFKNYVIEFNTIDQL